MQPEALKDAAKTVLQSSYCKAWQVCSAEGKVRETPAILASHVHDECSGCDYLRIHFFRNWGILLMFFKARARRPPTLFERSAR